MLELLAVIDNNIIYLLPIVNLASGVALTLAAVKYLRK